MKRIIGFLTLICMLAAFCPASYASVKGVREDLLVPANSLGYASSGVIYPGSTVDGESEKLLKYASNGNIGVYHSATKAGATGELYIEFKMKITNASYNSFRLQLVSTNSKDTVAVVFTPKFTGDTITGFELSPSSTYLGKNTVDEDIFGLNKWVTFCARVDNEQKEYDLSIKDENGEETKLYENQEFNKDDSNIGRVQLAFNGGDGSYAGPAYFKHFYFYKMHQVTEFVAIEDKKADIEKEFTLPSKVTAKLDNNTQEDLAVTWTSTDVTVTDGKCSFAEEKVYTFTGSVKESDKTVTLNVSVEKLPEITSLVNPENGEAEVNIEHTLPAKVMAYYDKGEPEEVSVTWSSSDENVIVVGGTCRFTQVGEYTLTGRVDGTNITASYTVDVKSTAITGCDKVTVYLEKYIDDMPRSVKVRYRDGSYGYEKVEWDAIDLNAPDMQTVNGTIVDYDGIIAADVAADVYIYDAGDALFEETANYDNGEYIRRQLLSPEPRVEDSDYWGWNTSVPEVVIAKPDPTNADNMAIYIPVNTSDKTTNDYSGIQVGEGREGISIISMDMLFPDAVTDIRTQILSADSGKIVENTYNAAKGSVSDTEGLFKVGEWTNFKWIVNMYTDKYDLLINNVRIKTGESVATPKKKNIYQIRFANYSDKSVDSTATAIYLDNVRMYHLTAMLDDDYEEVKLTNTNVTGNLSFNSPSDTSVTAVWESADTTLVENNGTVHFPAWKSGDKNAKVTLTLSKDIGAGYSAQKKASFDLVVKEAPPTDIEAVNATLQWLDFDKIKKDNTAENNILTDLNLLEKGLFGTTISWAGVNPNGPVDIEGKVYAPESADAPVTLTATVSRGSVSLTDTPINLTVKYQPELSDIQAVRRAKAQLSIGDTVDSSNTKLSLPSSGANGVSIAWKSLNTDKLSDKGEWQKPSIGGTAVIQAIITKGSARDTKEFNVSVASYSGGGGGGGSNGGGGGGGGTMIAPSTTPTITEPEKISPVYSDINGYDWAHTAIYALTNAGVITGTGDKKFEPARNVNREEFVAMAVRGFDINTTVDEFPFADVSESDWHYETTKKAYGFGLVSGISDNSFGSGMEIRRQDMFVIMYNAAKKLGISLKKVRDVSEFADSGDVSEYAIEAVTALYEAGIVNGYGDSISPLKSATRAEAAKMIYEIRALYTK